MKLFLSKKLNTNDKENAILAILNGMYSNKQDYVATSISLIGYEMTGRFLKTSNKRERTVINGIKEAMESLQNKGILEILEKDNDNYVLSSKGLIVDTQEEHFVLIEQWEMQKVFNDANKPFHVFDFFCSLIGTINNTTKEWHMSQDEIVANCRCSKRTVNSYLEQLEKMQLIYVYRHKKRRADGTYHKLNNSYGRYADKDSVIKAAQEYSNTVECEDILTKIDRRAIKLRYNAFCDGAKKYQDNHDAVVALYKECELYNKSLNINPVEGVYDGEWKQGEPLDLSVFPDYVIKNVTKNEHSDQWGEPDPMERDFSLEEILDMDDLSVSVNLPQRTGEVQSNPTSRETDSSLQREGTKPQMDSQKLTANLPQASRDDLELIDIDSLFEDEAVGLNQSVSQDEAWELFS